MIHEGVAASSGKVSLWWIHQGSIGACDVSSSCRIRAHGIRRWRPSGATWMMHGAELFMAKQSKLIARFYFIFYDELRACDRSRPFHGVA
jgi:hypothetical protein